MIKHPQIEKEENEKKTCLPRLNIDIPSPASDRIVIEFITIVGNFTCHLQEIKNIGIL